MNAAQQGTPADVTKFAYANLAPRLSLGVSRQSGLRERGHAAIDPGLPHLLRELRCEERGRVERKADRRVFIG